jgi:hypothetical protein
VSRSKLRGGQHPAAGEQAIKKRAYPWASDLKPGSYQRLFILIKSEQTAAPTI